MTCAECGTEMAKGSRFCHACGWDQKLAAAGKASSTAGQRPAWKRRLMSATLISAALLMLWLMLLPRGVADEVLNVGQAAPDFDLESLEGPRIKLSELRGRPVVVNFWATWCTPCRREMPDFQSVYERYEQDGLMVIGLNVGEARVGIEQFKDQVGFQFPVLIDTEETTQTAYRILPLPATFFIDRTGKINAIYQHQMSRSQIESEVIRILAK